MLLPDMEAEPPAKRARSDEFHMLTLRQCHGLLKPLFKMQDAHYFTVPVDWQTLNLPDYPSIVKSPMDLGTIRGRLEDGAYVSVDDLVRDVRLVFHNCRLYNPAHMPVGLAGAKVSATFESALEAALSSASNAAHKAAAHKSGGGFNVEASPDAPAAEYGMTSKNAKAIVRSLQQHGVSFAFRLPVDPVRLNLPTYTEVVKEPMDLSTVAAKCAEASYATVGDLRKDLDLIWDNAVLFNGAESAVGLQAVTLRAFTSKKFSQEGLPDDAPILASAAGAPKPGGAPRAARGGRGRGGGGRRGSFGEGRGGGGRPSLGAPMPGIAAAPDPAAVAMAAAADEVELVKSHDVMLTMKQCQQLLLPLKVHTTMAILSHVHTP